jgi:hypothetical protein
LLGTPRTDPDERNSRIRLLPRVFDGKADARPGMKDARSITKLTGRAEMDAVRRAWPDVYQDIYRPEELEWLCGRYEGGPAPTG